MTVRRAALLFYHHHYVTILTVFENPQKMSQFSNMASELNPNSPKIKHLKNELCKHYNLILAQKFKYETFLGDFQTLWAHVCSTKVERPLMWIVSHIPQCFKLAPYPNSYARDVRILL